MTLCPRWWHFSAQRCTHNSPAAIHRCLVFTAESVELLKDENPNGTWNDQRGQQQDTVCFLVILTNCTVHKQVSKRVSGYMLYDVCWCPRSSIVKVPEDWFKPRQPYKEALNVAAWGVCLAHSLGVVAPGIWLTQCADNAWSCWPVAGPRQFLVVHGRADSCRKACGWLLEAESFDDGCAAFDLHLSSQHFKTWQQHSTRTCGVEVLLLNMCQAGSDGFI